LVSIQSKFWPKKPVMNVSGLSASDEQLQQIFQMKLSSA